MVDSVRPAAEPAPKRGLFSRLGGRGPVVEEPTHDELTQPPVHLMYLPLTGFGNVTLGDSVHLSKALRKEALTWAPPTIHIAGGTALEFKGDESVWAKLDGDIDALNTIGRGVPQIVQRLGFFVDRRQFRPWLEVGTITDATTAPYLQAVVDALEAFHGRSWEIDSISLMKGLPDPGPDSFEEVERMPLAPR